MRYAILGTLGSGSGSVVYMCKDRATNGTVAMKVFNEDYVKSNMKSVQREVKILSHLSFASGVVRLLAFFNDVNTGLPCLVFEKADMTLLDVLNSKGSFRPLPSGQFMKFVFTQLAYAVHEIHAKAIAHRDIKPENVLLFKRDIHHLEVKLCDFGYADVFKNGNQAVKACGSPLFCSPEIFLGNPYDPFKADIWSLSVTLYLSTFGRYPFQITKHHGNNVAAAIQDLFLEIESSVPSYDSDNISDDLRELLKLMLRKDPAERISACDIIYHKWITDSNCMEEFPPVGQSVEVSDDNSSKNISAAPR